MDTTKCASARCKLLRSEVRRFLARFAQDGTSALSRLLAPAQLQALVQRHCPKYRDRLYPPLVTVRLFLEQVLGADHSCQDAVAKGLSTRVAQGLSPCSLSTGPYCKARQRLSHGLLTELCQIVGLRLCQAQPEAWRWRGREVKLIDGTTVSMPDTLANQAQYPQSPRQRPGLGFPVMRIAGVGVGTLPGQAQWRDIHTQATRCGALTTRRCADGSLLRGLLHLGAPAGLGR